MTAFYIALGLVILVSGGLLVWQFATDAMGSRAYPSCPCHRSERVRLPR